LRVEDCRQFYYNHSGKASDVQRQLAFAGIAIIWVFRVSNVGEQKIPTELIYSATLFITAIAFDLLQYLSAAIMWGTYARRKELKINKIK